MSMLEVNLLMVRVPNGQGGLTEAREPSTAWICPYHVDTITDVNFKKIVENQLPANCRAVIRYRDDATGYRLFFVTNEPKMLARMVWRIRMGQDPQSADFSFSEE